LVSSRY